MTCTQPTVTSTGFVLNTAYCDCLHDLDSYLVQNERPRF